MGYKYEIDSQVLELLESVMRKRFIDPTQLASAFEKADSSRGGETALFGSIDSWAGLNR